jgi:hypothetical protein
MINYQDFANTVPMEAVEKPKVRGGVIKPFPIRLHMMLNKIEEDGFAHVVSWQPHGRSFIVHKQKQFVEHVMPTYFNQSKFASFQRQLNLYGFSRLTFGEDRGGYYHELFLRSKSFLCHHIERKKIKGTGVRPASKPESEPNFYKMPWVVDKSASPIPTISSTTSLEEESSMISDSDYEDLFDDDDIMTFAGMSFHCIETPPLIAPLKTPSNGCIEKAFPQRLDSDFDAVMSMSSLGLKKNSFEDVIHLLTNDTDFGFLLERTVN